MKAQQSKLKCMKKNIKMQWVIAADSMEQFYKWKSPFEDPIFAGLQQLK